MIYIVDEDVFDMEPFATALVINGYEVTQIDNADAAYERLSRASDIEAVVLDVMLSAEVPRQSRFTAEDTHNFLQTGLLLLRWLVDCRGREFAAKCVLFSMASQPFLVGRIREAMAEYGVPFWQKKDLADPLVFAEKLAQRIMATARGAGK